MSNRKRSNYSYSNNNNNDKRHQRDTEANTNSNNIPGFYYDEEKKKYFKIQPNHQRQTNCVTNDLIKTKLRDNDLSKILKITKPINLIKNILLNFELGVSRDLYNDRNNYIVSNLKCKSKIELDIRNKIKRTYMVQLDKNTDNVYLLLDCLRSIEFLKVYKTHDKFSKKTQLKSLNSDSNITDYENVRLLNIQDNRYFIQTVELMNSYTTNVSEFIMNQDENIFGKFIFSHNFYSENDIWCNRINSNFEKTFSKISYGTEKNAMVFTPGGERSALVSSFTNINTLKSGVFCQRFHPIVGFL